MQHPLSLFAQQQPAWRSLVYIYMVAQANKVVSLAHIAVALVDEDTAPSCNHTFSTKP